MEEQILVTKSSMPSFEEYVDAIRPKRRYNSDMGYDLVLGGIL